LAQGFSEVLEKGREKQAREGQGKKRKEK